MGDRGTSAIREGAYFQASKALERALEIDNAFALARARRAEAYAEWDSPTGQGGTAAAMALLPDRSNLSAAESNYVDAVAATLGRNFKTAIEKLAHREFGSRRGKVSGLCRSRPPMRKTRISIEPLNRA